MCVKGRTGSFEALHHAFVGSCVNINLLKVFVVGYPCGFHPLPSFDVLDNNILVWLDLK
jgi:hypothetical protein